MKLLFLSIIFLTFIGCHSKNEELSADPNDSRKETGTPAETPAAGAGDPPEAGAGKPLPLEGAAGAGATEAGAGAIEPEAADKRAAEAGSVSLGGRSGPPPAGRVTTPAGSGAAAGADLGGQLMDLGYPGSTDAGADLGGQLVDLGVHGCGCYRERGCGESPFTRGRCRRHSAGKVGLFFSYEFEKIC